MRLAVAATAPLGADVLERLAAQHEIAYLLTQPDRPRGRGRRVAPPPAKEIAERLGIPVRQPERLGDEFDPEVDALVAVAYGQLVPRGALESARWLNVHPSLLPRWRGAAPVERALMAGDEETGVTIIELVEELDAGPIASSTGRGRRRSCTTGFALSRRTSGRAGWSREGRRSSGARVSSTAGWS